MRLSEVGAPVSTSDGHDGKLGNDDGSADSGGHLLGGLDTETDVALAVADNDDSLETGALTSTGLLLHGLDLQISHNHQYATLISLSNEEGSPDAPS